MLFMMENKLIHNLYLRNHIYVTNNVMTTGSIHPNFQINFSLLQGKTFTVEI